MVYFGVGDRGEGIGGGVHGEERSCQDAFLVNVAPIIDILYQRIFCDTKVVGIVDLLLEGEALFVGEGSVTASP